MFVLLLLFVILVADIFVQIPKSGLLSKGWLDVTSAKNLGVFAAVVLLFPVASLSVSGSVALGIVTGLLYLRGGAALFVHAHARFCKSENLADKTV